MARKLASYIAALVLVFIASHVFSQTAPTAPLPTQIMTAKTVFISNLLGQDISAPIANPSYYNAFYAAIKEGGRYSLVSTPEEADLIFQLRAPKDMVQLTIIDPHSNIALWAISRNMSNDPAIRSINDLEKRIQSSIVGLADDLKELVTSPASSTSTTQKVH